MSEREAISRQAPDADVERRPGRRKEHEPRRVHRAHWDEPERQTELGLEILREPSRQSGTATFGTQHQPKGVSGMLRRRAYRIPDYRPSRWLLLIAADRIEKVEASLEPPRPRTLVLAASAATLGLGMYLYLRQRRHRSWRDVFGN